MKLCSDEKDGTKDGLIDSVYEYPESGEHLITSYTVAPNGSVITGFKGEADSDEGLEMLWGLIWGEESEENIQQYYQDNYDRK